MSRVQRPVVVFHAVLGLVAALLVLTPDRPAAQAVAAGSPYADPAVCSALAAQVVNFETKILPRQAQDLAYQQKRLSEAEAGRAESAEEFNKALRDGAMTLATDQLTTAKALRARVEAMKASGMNAATRRQWLEGIKKLEDASSKIKQEIGRADFVEALRQNQTDLVTFMKFVDESGAADAALKGLAETLAPGVGGLVVNGIKVGLDVAYAGLKGRFTAQEAAQWRDNVAKLSAAHEELKERISNQKLVLSAGACGPRVAQQVQESPKPVPPTEAVQARPTATTVPPPAASGPSIGKILGWTAVVAGGAIGGAWAYEQAQLLAEESALYTTPTSTPSTSSPAPTTPTASTGSTITAFQITCTLSNAGTFRTCVGFFTATIGPSVTAGVQLVGRTIPSEVLGRVTPTVTGAGQSLRFEVSTSSTAACPTISGVNFVRATDVNSAFTSASRSITVTCN